MKYPTKWHVTMAEAAVKDALQALCTARDHLAYAGADKTLQRTRLAISSCKGALRNARARAFREYAEARRIMEECDREYLVIDKREVKS
jgi:hypothetical protein